MPIPAIICFFIWINSLRQQTCHKPLLIATEKVKFPKKFDFHYEIEYNIGVKENEVVLMNIFYTVSELIQQNNGLLRTSDALEAGISKTTLSNLVKKGMLDRVAHGQYILPDNLPDELYILQQRISKMVYSHETALFLLDMAERTPARQSVTIQSDNKLPKTFVGDYKVYYVKPDLFELGLATLPSKMGHDVKAYDAERTICDILRSRSRIDSQTFAFAMKNYAARKDKDINRLSRYAEAFRVTKLLRQYLEVLL